MTLKQIAISMACFITFTGCSQTVSSITISDPVKHNKVMQKTIKHIVDAKKNYDNTKAENGVIRRIKGEWVYPTKDGIEPNSKVFFINAHPDEKLRAKAMFNYMIKAMQEKGICFEDKDEGIEKCAKPKIEITENGEEANLVLKTLNGKMSTNEAYSAVMQFNKKYFPGFEVLRPEATIKSIFNLKIYNKYLDDELYERCIIDGALEEALKEKGCQIVDNPDKADYIIVYQSLACVEKYVAHQPKSLMSIVDAKDDIKTADNKKMNAFTRSGSVGLINGIGYGNAFSVGFGTYWTPTVIGFGALSLFLPGYVSYSGSAYEYIIIDNKKKRILNEVVVAKERDELAKFVRFRIIRNNIATLIINAKKRRRS